ncbi:Hypothetical protein FKW44_019434, partial [Caligus rogercresseyi]
MSFTFHCRKNHSITIRRILIGSGKIEYSGSIESSASESETLRNKDEETVPERIATSTITKNTKKSTHNRILFLRLER